METIEKNNDKKETSKKNTGSKKIKLNTKAIRVIITILLLLIPMGLSVYYRIQPAYLPLMDQQAESNVMNYFQGQIQQEIDSKYAYLPPEKRAELVDQQMQLFIEQERDNLKTQIELTAKQMKAGMQDENGDTYLLAIDPWMQYKYAKNYVETGTYGDSIIDGKPVNTLRGGRNIHNDRDRFHPWLMSKFHKLLNIFNKDISVMRSVFFFPMVWVTLAIIPAFFIGRRLSNNLGGFISAMIVAVHQAILSRTVAGFSDTDAHNVFFPLFITWFIIEAYHTKDMKNKICFGGLAGLFTGFYSMAWTGWWYTFDFIVLSLIGFIIIQIIKNIIDKNKLKNIFSSIKKEGLIFGVYFGLSFIFITILQGVFLKSGLGHGLRIFGKSFGMPLSFLKYQDVGITTIWPNVLTTVAELNPASLQKVLGSMGLTITLFLAFIGLIILTVNKKLSKEEKYLFGGSIVWYMLLIFLRQASISVYSYLFMITLPVIVIAIYTIFKKSNFDIKYTILFAVFFTGTLLAATKGIRFLALAVPFFAILLGISTGKIYDYLSNWLSESININKILVRVVLIVLVLWIIVPTPVNAGWKQTLGEIPSYNDAWDETLTTINQSSEDAIITSWWDFGHWFVAGSERRVTFDGGSQGDRIHWVGKTLLTEDEDEAIDILRMLNCGQNDARYRLEELYEDDYKAIKTLYEVISVDKEEAKNILQKTGVTTEDINYLLEKTHCEDLIDNYYIASEDMIGKSGVWGHFGVWDFDRAYLFNTVTNSNLNEATEFLINEYNYSENEAKALYYEIQTADGDRWISPWPSYGSSVSRCQTVNETIQCETGLIYNVKTDEAIISTTTGIVKPKRFSYIRKGEFKIKEYEDGYEIGMALFPNKGGGFSSIAMDPKQTASMFTRLYFFGGLGLKHFEQVSHKVGIDGTDIFLYKVNWEGNEIKE